MCLFYEYKLSLSLFIMLDIFASSLLQGSVGDSKVKDDATRYKKISIKIEKVINW